MKGTKVVMIALLPDKMLLEPMLFGQKTPA